MQENTTILYISVKEGIDLPKDPFLIFPSFEKAFYFEQPDKEIIYCAIGSLIDLSSDNGYDFKSVKEKIKDIKIEFTDNSYDNLDFPIVLGGMKFPGIQDDTSEDWKDYENSDWFIPKYFLMRRNYKNYFISFSKEKNIYNDLYKEFLSEWCNENYMVQDNHEAYLTQNILKYKWHLLVEKAVAEIKKGTFSKVVLSRKVDLDIKGEINFNKTISSLRKLYKSCTLFVYKSKDSYFFGATPEKAASIKNGIAEFDALAGSAPRGIDKLTDSRYEKYLLNSIKDRDEHNYVIEYIKNESAALVKEFAISETIVKKLNNIQHLFTGISAEIKDTSFIFPLLDKVIPTPAVCGLPKQAALDFIINNEGYTRGLYSGVIGWFNLKYEGEFMAALRSALYKKNKLSIFAGCGIIEDSDPAKEYEETELKLLPIMSIFL